jgi:flagellar brake protein
MFSHTQPALLDPGGGIDPFAQFRVSNPREVSALVRQLADCAVPVHLSAPGGQALTAIIWTVDSAKRRIVFSADSVDPRLPALAEEQDVTAVSYLEAVKLQFDLRDLMVVHSAEQCSLHATLPAEVYRFQRRSSYRVRTLESSAPTAQFRHPAIPEMQLALRVLDVSIGGCALFLPADVPPIQPGVQLNAVRFELSADTRFDAGLMLHHVTSIQPSSRGVRLGCELVHMGSMAERALQRYIDQTQKRRRLLEQF